MIFISCKNRRYISRVLVFLIIILIYQPFLHSSALCEVSPDDERVKKIIELVKIRFNIKSLRCKYTSTVELDPEFVEKREKEGKKIREEEIYEQRDNIDFIFQGGNFVRTFTDIEKEEENEEPRNLLEFLSLKLNEKSPRKEDKERISQDIYYFYNGALIGRLYHYLQMFDRLGYVQPWDETRDFHGQFFDPRFCFGYCECRPGSRGNSWADLISFYITDFLDREGKFYYEERDGYKILWHGCNMIDRNNYTLPITIELWIDAEENIQKISFIFYPNRFLDREKVVQLIGEDNDCNYPSLIQWENYYYDFKEFGNGIRLPMRTLIVQYFQDTLDPCFLDTFEEYGRIIEKEGRYEEVELQMSLLKCGYKPIRIETIEMLIYPETVVINEPIPEETFIAPEPDIPYFKNVEEEDEFMKKHGRAGLSSDVNEDNFNKWNIPIRAIVFAGVGVLIVLVLMYLTHSYLGWSFF